ncbi:MAG TPA: serine--tRNA ligase [Candidatus Omnitrophica bacterium]|nr:serine--tRNA ligase [Candidatus Omnitrophota bacterium]
MLDIRFIRENSEIVKEALKKRYIKFDLDELLSLDNQRRKIIKEVDSLKHERNKASKEIGSLLKEGKDAEDKKRQMKTLSQKIKDMDSKVKDIDKKMAKILYNIPNIPHNSVPIGRDDKSNKIIREWGTKRRFDFKPQNHLYLAEYLDIIDFARGSKITGSNFPLYKGSGARLERALINFMLDLHTKRHGYKELWPPSLVNRLSMTGTGQLPKLEEDMYRLKDDDYFLIPTAEVPVTNIHRDEFIDADSLPLCYTAYTPCFRREAGSYGKETKGLIRVHQFDKVELVKFVMPEDSYDELESLLKDAEEVLQLLELPYRVCILSTGELSFAAAKCYDIEAWSAVSGYLEVSSCSNFEDFQARRANIRYKQTTDDGREIKGYVHTLNGSGVALARTVIAILENYQQKDGSVVIPEVLQRYMDGQKVIKPA